MARGEKTKYTEKQKRQAEHIEEGYEDRGVPEKEAERRAWATVNKMTGGGKSKGRSWDRGRNWWTNLWLKSAAADGFTCIRRSSS